jgi:hypothetical protein
MEAATVTDTGTPVQAIVELCGQPRWVVWCQEQRPDEDKPTKVPYIAASPRHKASSTDPSTWGTYAEARAAVDNGRADGPGYVFDPDTGIAGIDLDDCLDTETGEIDPVALSIIRRLDSYTEISPSGRGVHIYVRAVVGGKGVRKKTSKTPWGGQFENYDRGRFFTFTGHHLPGTPTTIEPRQGILDEIRHEMFGAKPKPSLAPRAPSSASDEDILEKIRKSKQGHTFDALWRGDTSAHNDDESSADLALCNILAFWFGDPARIDSMFRNSGLMRDKWDSPRPGGTYGSQTIDLALDGRTEFYGQKNSSNGAAPPKPKYEGRAEAEAGARDEIARLLGLDDRKVLRGRSWGHDLKATVEIDIDDGTTLRLDPLGSYTAPAKLNAEIAFQIGAMAKLNQAGVNELLGHLRIVLEFREAVTLDRRATDLGISFLQDAQVWPADMNDQAQRWTAFEKLAAVDPASEARSSGKSQAAESIVIDSLGTRLVRVAWFASYVRASSSPGQSDEILRRMLALGWTQPGGEGRIKATQPGGTRTLQWAFFVVPEGWERQ